MVFVKWAQLVDISDRVMFQELILRARSELLMSDDELARYLKVSPSTLDRWVSGLYAPRQGLRPGIREALLRRAEVE